MRKVETGLKYAELSRQEAMFKPIAFFSALVLLVPHPLQAAPIFTKQGQVKKLHKGSVQCTLIRYRPKIKVNKYKCKVYEYADRSSVVVSDNGYSIKFPKKYARPYYVLDTDPLIINKWKDFTLQIEGLMR